MSEDSTSIISINSHSTWSSNRYYEIILVAFSLGLADTEQFIEENKRPGLHFLFTYITLLLVLGVPLIIIELSLGQYSRKGLIKFWEICPIFYGFGYISFIFISAYLIRNLMVSSQLVRYTLNQLIWESGWDKCTNDWNTEYCYTLNSSIIKKLDCYDIHGQEDCDKVQWESSYSQYFYNIIVGTKNDFISWRLLLIVTIIILMLGGVAYKGYRFMEKCILICILVAAINFSILFYVCLIQRGTGEGLKFYMRFDVGVMYYSHFWNSSFKLMLWSTGIGIGALKLLGSQNKFRGHSYMNGLMIALLHITVMFVEIIFYLGLCGNTGYALLQPVNISFVDKEPFIFAKIPKMLESLNGSHKFWCFLYFSHILFILFSKMSVLLHMILESTVEIFPRTEYHQKKTVFVVCGIIILCCIPLTSQFGGFLFIFIDMAIIRGSVQIIFLVLQITVIIYIYGLTTVVDDLHFMLGFRISLFYQVILFLSPIIIFVFSILQIIEFFGEMETNQFLSENGKIVMSVAQFSPIIVAIVYAIWYTRKMIWKCEWENVFLPSDSWYLSDQILRKSREMFSSSNMTEEYLYRQSKRREIHAHEAMYDE